MLTVKIEALDCKQVRPCRKEVTLRLHLLDDDQEVLTTDCTEPLGDAPPGSIGDLASLRDRFAKRMQAAVEQYKSDQYFFQTSAITQLATDVEAALRP
jgi:hypothetical protein